MKSLNYYKSLLLQEMDEKKLSKKQMDIADEAEPFDKITGADFKALKAKKGVEESSEKSDWTVGEEIVGSEKRYFLYNQETGKRKGIYKSKEEAESNINEHHNDPNFPGGPAIHDLLDRVAEDWGNDSDLYNDLEAAIVGWSDRNGNLTPKGKIAVKALLSNWDVLDDYGWLLDPKPADHTGETTGMMEGGDHEVSMAQNSLESIIKSAAELKSKLGGNEKDIPAWIQDHITNAENYINQASKNYHEYSEEDMNELPVGNEEEPLDSMSLQGMMEDLLEAKKKKPSAGLSKKQKSAIVKKAKKGKDFGKKGPGFKDIEKKAKAAGAKDPQAVAGAAFWKAQAKKAK